MAPSDTLIGGDRPVTFCPACKKADDHPKHLRFEDGPDMGRHMDCCRAGGCPDGSCDVVTAGAEELRGVELLDHIKEVGSFGAALAEYQAEHPEQVAAYTGTEPVVLGASK